MGLNLILTANANPVTVSGGGGVSIFKTAYSGTNGAAASEVGGAYYSNAVSGPFGESTVARFPVTAGNNFYGGTYSPAIRGISLSEGDEIWVRQYTYFPSSYCAGYQSGSDGWGGLKYLRLQYGTSDLGPRLTFQLWHPSVNACGSAASMPAVWGATRESITGGNMDYASPAVIPRDQWVAIQFYVKFSDSAGTGKIRAWIGTTYLGEVLGVTLPATDRSLYDIYVGNYWNGAPVSSCEFYHGDTIIAMQTPPTTDSGGRPYISPTSRSSNWT